MPGRLGPHRPLQPSRSPHSIMWRPASVGTLGGLTKLPGARGKAAVKAPMMATLPKKASPAVPKVPGRPGAGRRSCSQARREHTSQRMASSWKWVPSTAQMWKSWWLCPTGVRGQCHPWVLGLLAQLLLQGVLWRQGGLELWYWGLLLTNVVEAAGRQALRQVGCEEEASEQCKEEVVAVPGHSLIPGAVTPEAEEKLWIDG